MRCDQSLAMFPSLKITQDHSLTNISPCLKSLLSTPQMLTNFFALGSSKQCKSAIHLELFPYRHYLLPSCSFTVSYQKTCLPASSPHIQTSLPLLHSALSSFILHSTAVSPTIPSSNSTFEPSSASSKNIPSTQKLISFQNPASNQLPLSSATPN